jgi:hypothetical protein
MARAFDDLNFSTLTPFQEWQADHFAGGSSNPDAAPGADPDNDGLNNAGEYAFGADPNLAGPNPVTTSIVTIDGERYLQVSIPKNPDASDATIAVQASPEIAPATWSSDGLVIEENTSVLLRVRDTIPVSSVARRFFRIQVTLN